VKYWEIVADNLSKAGWSWGYVSAPDSNGRTIWIADAQRGDEKRFVEHAEEKADRTWKPVVVQKINQQRTRPLNNWRHHGSAFLPVSAQ
jgi:hypothetical protein